jgi:hypothetical protein
MTLKAPRVTVTSAAQLNIRKLPPLSLDRKDFIFSHKVRQGPEFAFAVQFVLASSWA